MNLMQVEVLIRMVVRYEDDNEIAHPREWDWKSATQAGWDLNPFGIQIVSATVEEERP